MVSPNKSGIVAAVCLAAMLGGCAQPDRSLTKMTYNGDLGNARAYMAKKVGTDPNAKPDGDYVLNRMRLGLVTLGDGYAPAENGPWDQVYRILRTSDVNKDKQAAVVILNESVKTWKGEPFEQALALHYIGLHYAMQGSWDNSRAAYDNSLFQLKAVAADENGHPLSTEEAIKKVKTEEDVKNAQSVPTNFTLGYLMRGVVFKQLQISTGSIDRGRDAEESFNSALRISPELADLAGTLRNPMAYNTVLVVDYGQGPQKIATGMDHVISSFKDLTLSDARDLEVRTTAGSAGQTFRQVCDINSMAHDHRWNSLENMRKAKSYIGTAMMAGGAAVAAASAYQNSEAGAFIGLGLMIAGAAEKAAAHADTRYCELMPQRVYVVPVMITQADTPVSVMVGGVPSSQMTLRLDPPSSGTTQLRYVRLLCEPSQSSTEDTVRIAPPAFVPPAWATSGKILYSSDDAREISGVAALPYILGGHCVCSPSERSLAAYQRAGFLKGMTVDQLRHLYIAEKIALTPQDEHGIPGKHILEGGNSLVCPKKGTLGFARLMGMEHPAYKPKSDEVKALKAQIDAQLKSTTVAQAVVTPNSASKLAVGY